jgi:hypothetical protein
MADHMSVEGWLVCQVETEPGLGSGRYQYEGRLFLFRTERDWTLLSVTSTTEWVDDGSRPVSGRAAVDSETYGSLDELRAGVQRAGCGRDWAALVRAGARSEWHRDPDLEALWAPIQIDIDLRESSVHRRGLGVGGGRRRLPGWEDEALRLGIGRLEELGFAVLRRTTDATTLFPARLVHEHGNVVVGAVEVARYGLKVRVLVAIDGAGEVFSRTGDSIFEPGGPRRYPPRPLTEQEARAVEAVLEQRMGERSDG